MAPGLFVFPGAGREGKGGAIVAGGLKGASDTPLVGECLGHGAGGRDAARGASDYRAQSIVYTMPESGVNVTARFVKAEEGSSIALRVKGVEVGAEPLEESASGRHSFSMGVAEGGGSSWGARLWEMGVFS